MKGQKGSNETRSLPPERILDRVRFDDGAGVKGRMPTKWYDQRRSHKEMIAFFGSGGTP
jgi:hypothetical protein